MNMTEIFEHDQKYHTDKHYLLEHYQKCTTVDFIIIFCILFVTFSCCGTYYPMLSFFSWRHQKKKRDFMRLLLFRSNSLVHVRRLNDFFLNIFLVIFIHILVMFLQLRFVSVIFRFQRSCSSVWIFFGHILTHFWSYWFGQNN